MKLGLFIIPLCTMLLGAAQKHTLTVKVTALNEARGDLFIALYNSEDSWMDTEQAVSTKVIPIPKQKEITLQFDGLASGEYGFAFFHDTNKNQEVDMQWLPPKPTEGLGASNNATGSFGPPDWKDAKFRLDASTKKEAKMVYL